MKCLLVLTGESFRLGGQMTRSRSDSPESTNRQKIATYSHLRILNYMKSAFNVDTDIFINSYTLNPSHDAMLLDWYKPYVVYSEFKETILESENILVLDTNHKILAMGLDEYDFVLFVRIDMYMKKYFFSRFTKLDNFVRYGHLDCNTGGVCHNLIYLPKKYFSFLENNSIENDIRSPHISETILKKVIPRIEIDYFIRSYHSLSTDLYWNPLYSQVGRDESFNRENIGERFINNTNVTIHDSEYDHLLHTDTIAENLKLLEEGKINLDKPVCI